MAVYNSTTHEIASNSLTNGLIFAVYLEDSNTDPVLGAEAKDNSTGAGVDGWTQSGSEVLSFDFPSGLNPTNGTVIDMFFGAAVSSPASYGKFGITTDSEFQLSRNNADIGLRIQINNSLMQFPSGDIPTNFWDDAENQIAWRWSNGDTGQVSANTTHSPTQTITAWPTTAFSNATFSFGNRSVADGANRQIDGRLKYRFVWDRALSNAEIDAIYADPYQLIQPVSAGGSTTDIYINFESGGAAPTTPWSYNQPAFTSGTGVLVADLVDSANQATGYGLEIVTAFAANSNSDWADTDVGDWQEAVFDDVWYTTNGGSSSFKFTGLPAGADYTLELAGHNGNSRDTDFTVEGTTLEYNTSDTATPTAPVSFSGTVDPDGEIVVSLERSAADGQFYGYVNGGKLSITESVAPPAETTTVIIDHNVPADAALKWGESYTVTVTQDSGPVTYDTVTLTPPDGWTFVNFASIPTLSSNPAEPGSIYEALTNYAPLSNYTMQVGADQLAFQSAPELTMNDDTTFVVNPARDLTIQAKVWKDATSEWTSEFTIQINDLGVPVIELIEASKLLSSQPVESADLTRYTNILANNSAASSSAQSASATATVTIVTEDGTSSVTLDSIDANVNDGTVVIEVEAAFSASSLDAGLASQTASIVADAVLSTNETDSSTILHTASAAADEVISNSSLDQIAMAKTSSADTDALTSSSTVENAIALSATALTVSDMSSGSSAEVPSIDITINATPEDLSSGTKISRIFIGRGGLKTIYTSRILVESF